MNLHVPHGPGPRAEVGVLSDICNAFISVKTGGPVNGQVQDSVVGCAELTRDGVRLDRYHAMALFASAGLEDQPDFGDAASFSGREAVSLALAAAPVNYSRRPTSFNEVYAPFLEYPPGETLTVVERGRLTQGVLDGKAIGAKSAGGLFHLIGLEHGSRRAFDMIFAVQQVALQFLAFRGFTVGAADLLPGPEARARIDELLARVLLEAELVTGRLLRGELVPPIGETVRSHYERLQINALGLPEAELLRWILADMRPASNGLLRMILTGAKGKNPNLLHISGKIGQTLINGERIREQFAFRRTSPYFPRFDTRPASYGFIGHGYMEGMTASEVLFQAMNGRFDLISKALTTSSTGHFMRKGAMNNQSSLVDNHRRVSKDTHVVQFLYGEDGLDPRRLEKVELRFLALGDAALRAAFGLDLAAAGAEGPGLAEAQAAADAALERLRADRDALAAPFARIEDANFDYSFPAEALLPVNLRRVVAGLALAAQGRPAAPLRAAALAARIARVEDVCGRLAYTLLNEIQERRRAPIPAPFAAAAQLLAAHVRAELAPPVLARLSDDDLTFALDTVRGRYAASLASYGLAVGLIAAQAISEPLTQYMLDSHHRSVGGGTSKGSLQRVSEVFGARGVGDEHSSAMQLPLRLPELDEAPAGGAPPELTARWAAALAQAQAVANSIEHITLERLVARYDVLLEPLGALVYPPTAADAAWLAEFAEAHPLVRPPGDLTSWCLRLVLDKGQLALKDIALEFVVARLRERQPLAFVVHTSEAVPEVVLRVWLRAAAFRRGGEEEARATEMGAALLATPLRGVPGVLRAEARFVSRRRRAADGARASKKCLVVATAGTNLYGAVLHSAVDATRAISTSVADTLQLLGIEAARAKILSETRTLLSDNAPTPRHLALYADEMTRTGTVTSFERGGHAAREVRNTLLRMAFGDPVKALEDAALAGARNKVYGVAAPMMLGALPRVGSTYNSFVVDEAFCRANVRTLERALAEL
jgi:DNA-directed RNA polymerase beta' subunit